LLSRIGWIPDLHLGDATEVDAAIAVLLIFQSTHISKSPCRAGREEEVGLPSETRTPSSTASVCGYLHFLYAGADDIAAIFRSSPGADPAVEVVAVEEGFGTFGGYYLLRAGGVVEGDLRSESVRELSRSGGEQPCVHWRGFVYR
jgi:hypothetical protein